MQEKLEKLSTHDSIRAITFAEVVILVMDATHPFEIQDLQIADLVEREGRGLVFVLAKWDLVEDPQAKLAEIHRGSRSASCRRCAGTPIIALSAETGRGLEKLMPAVFKVHDDWSTKVKTRDLNDWLAMATERHPPPAVGGRRIKPKYMAQTKARPPTFVLFASRADQMPESYRRYLINSLRESFDLPGVPIRVTVKSNKNPYAEGEEKAGRAPPRAVRPARRRPANDRPEQRRSARRPRPRPRRARQASRSRRQGRSRRPKAKIGNPRGRARSSRGPASSRSERPGLHPAAKATLAVGRPRSACASSTISGPISEGSGRLIGSSPGMASARICVRMTPGIQQHGADLGLLQLVGPGAHQVLQPGLGDAVGAPEGLRTRHAAAWSGRSPARPPTPAAAAPSARISR